MRPAILTQGGSSTTPVQVVLVVWAVVVVLAGAGISLLWFLNTKEHFTLHNIGAFLPLCATVGLSWTAAAVLLGLASMLQALDHQTRQQHDQAVALRELNHSVQQLSGATPAAAPWAAASSEPVAVAPVSLAATASPVPRAESAEHTPPLPPAMAEQLIALLGQLRDLNLMADGQRQLVAQRYWDDKREQFKNAIEYHMRGADWAAAQEQINALRQVLPDDPLTQTMTDQLILQRADRAKQDLDATRPQIQHFMSITAWPQAEELINRLEERYPGEPEIEAMAAEVKREREAFEKENFSRLLLELRDANDRREWRRAYVAAQELVRRYPKDRKVEKLRNEQLATIKENAEAQERKEEEALFKDLLQRQRYDDAAVVARRVIDRYPTSNTALELNKLLPKVEELIRQEKLKKQGAEVKET